MLSRKRKQFDSQLSRRDKDEENEHSTLRGKKRNKEEKFVFKVKLLKSKKASKEEEEAPRRLMCEPTANTTESTESRGGARTQSDSVGGGVFFFSASPTSKVVNEKEKAKLSVVRTIARMLEENQLIRQRLAALSQIHSLH